MVALAGRPALEPLTLVAPLAAHLEEVPHRAARLEAVPHRAARLEAVAAVPQPGTIIVVSMGG